MRAIWLAVAVAGAGLVSACKDTNNPHENAAPSANFTFSCPILQCTFHDASTDDDQIVSWSWSFGAEGSGQRNPIYNYPSAGTYDVSLTVTDNEGLTSSVTKTVNPKDPAITTLSCVDGDAPGGYVACTLKLEARAGFKVVLNNSSCEAHGNVFRIIAPTPATLTQDGCYQSAGTSITLAGPYDVGTEINAEVVAPLLQNPPRLKVEGNYPVWHLTYEDGADNDFDDLDITLTALPTN